MYFVLFSLSLRMDTHDDNADMTKTHSMHCASQVCSLHATQAVTNAPRPIKKAQNFASCEKKSYTVLAYANRLWAQNSTIRETELLQNNKSRNSVYPAAVRGENGLSCSEKKRFNSIWQFNSRSEVVCKLIIQ